jgi:hypothetical protein
VVGEGNFLWIQCITSENHSDIFYCILEKVRRWSNNPEIFTRCFGSLWNFLGKFCCRVCDIEKGLLQWGS